MEDIKNLLLFKLSLIVCRVDYEVVKWCWLVTCMEILLRNTEILCQAFCPGIDQDSLPTVGTEV